MSLSAFTRALAEMDPFELALGAGLIGIITTLMAVGAVVWYFVSALGYYKMFQKAGEKGWMAFIPVLRDFIRFRICWALKPFLIYIIAMVAFELMAETDVLLVSLIGTVCGIVGIVYDYKSCNRLAKSFGKGKLWGALLFFFPYIFTLILGFGKAEYIGNTTVAQEAQPEEAPQEEIPQITE